MVTEQNTNNSTKQGLKYWLIGVLTGGSVVAPLAVFFTNKYCKKKAEEMVAEERRKAYSEGETAGLNAMAEYVVQNGGRGQMPPLNANEGHSEGTVEEPAPGDTDGDDNLPTKEEIDNWNLDVDDEEATEEARERTEAHERYLDMISKYTDADIRPRLIDGDEFLNDNYMQKSYVNWYEEDDVFEEDLHVIEDPYQSFGVVSGRDLFANADNRPDPDICYVRNERYTTDFEISRIHGSYAKIVEAKESLGQTDS